VDSHDAPRHADSHPSYVKWTWQIAGHGGGAEITVTWDCYLRSLDRRVFGGPVRQRQLAREVPASLTALARALSATPATQ
jgi:hypothetical protein